MKYLSVCSGIEAASVAWHGLGWEPVAFSEIDPFASAVLAARFPHVPNLGNMEAHASWPIEPGSVDLLVGGTPCQSFSVAGLRKGLADPRGNLALVYLAIVDRLRPRWVVWENVPGVLSSNGGRDFGAFLGGLAQLGYGFAFRVMDAQFVRVESHPRAVPQRRRRVFVVGCAGGDWRSAAEVLLEPEGVRGDSPPRREAGKETAQGARPGATSGGVAGTVAEVAGTLGVRGTRSHTELDGHGAHVVEPLPFDTTQVTSVINRSNPKPGDPCHPLTRGGAAPSVAFTTRGRKDGLSVECQEELSYALKNPGSGGRSNDRMILAPAVAFQWPVDVADPITAVEGRTYTHEGTTFRMHNVVPDAVAVRRLTPRECERLQGFSDDWTAIEYRGKPAADGVRYKALGNSMAVNVMRWIGERLSAVHRKP